MDKRLTAIVIKATDLRESDKTVRLFSVEEGLVSATMRGVRKPRAKLKYAAAPLALCRYELSDKAGRLTVTGAEQIDDLYELCLTPEKYAAAGVITETVEKAALSVEPDRLFVVMLKALKNLLSGGDCTLTCAKFIQKVLSMSGFVRLPERSTNPASSPSGVLDDIAYLTLGELDAAKYPPGLALKALALSARRFEKVYETAFASLPVYMAMVGR